MIMFCKSSLAFKGLSIFFCKDTFRELGQLIFKPILLLLNLDHDIIFRKNIKKPDSINWLKEQKEASVYYFIFLKYNILNIEGLSKVLLKRFNRKININLKRVFKFSIPYKLMKNWRPPVYLAKYVNSPFQLDNLYEHLNYNSLVFFRAKLRKFKWGKKFDKELFAENEKYRERLINSPSFRDFFFNNSYIRNGFFKTNKMTDGFFGGRLQRRKLFEDKEFRSKFFNHFWYRNKCFRSEKFRSKKFVGALYRVKIKTRRYRRTRLIYFPAMYVSLLFKLRNNHFAIGILNRLWESKRSLKGRKQKIALVNWMLSVHRPKRRRYKRIHKGFNKKLILKKVKFRLIFRRRRVASLFKRRKLLKRGVKVLRIERPYIKREKAYRLKFKARRYAEEFFGVVNWNRLFFFFKLLGNKKFKKVINSLLIVVNWKNKLEKDKAISNLKSGAIFSFGKEHIKKKNLFRRLRKKYQIYSSIKFYYKNFLKFLFYWFIVLYDNLFSFFFGLRVLLWLSFVAIFFVWYEPQAFIDKDWTLFFDMTYGKVYLSYRIENSYHLDNLFYFTKMYISVPKPFCYKLLISRSVRELRSHCIVSLRQLISKSIF